MRSAPPDLVLIGDVVTGVRGDRFAVAHGVAIASDRVVATGGRDELLAAAGPGTRVIRADGAAVVPGLHDFHLHLVGMARARRSVDLASATSMDEIVACLAGAAASTPAGEWVRGAGWRTEVLDPGELHRLVGVLEGRRAVLQSHDRHSAWASPAALRDAGIDEDPPDPPGGRFERGPDGQPNGILRELAADVVVSRAGRLAGPALERALGEVVDELLGLGFTGATDAGDATDAGGIGTLAPFGDSFSSLAAASGELDGRFRLTLDIPAAAIGAAVAAGLRSGSALPGTRTLRIGWAKAYADGALGSRTAALFAPYRCGPADTGILRLQRADLDALVATAREAGVALAIHAIGDRAASTVLDALEVGRRPATGAPPDRMEHLQLLRATDLPRLAALDITASLQPMHLPSDLDAVRDCWPDRLPDAYRCGSVAMAGARLAFGSDGPIEPVNPWSAVHVAVHRRLPAGEEVWHPDEAISPAAALGAYTSGPAAGHGRADIGHLRPGAVADLAVLSCGIGALREAGAELATATSRMTVVNGRVVREA